jgi:hypothetical protein
VLGRIDELGDGSGGSVDAVTGAAVHIGNPGLNHFRVTLDNAGGIVELAPH